MSEKRFTVKSIKNNHYQIAENDLKMLSNEVVDYMNTSSDAICSLQYEYVKLKKKVDEQQEKINELKKDLIESQGSYVRLVCFVRRLDLEGDDLARFEEEIGVNDE